MASISPPVFEGYIVTVMPYLPLTNVYGQSEVARPNLKKALASSSGTVLKPHLPAYSGATSVIPPALLFLSESRAWNSSVSPQSMFSAGRIFSAA
jgi:hypothetical protein